MPWTGEDTKDVFKKVIGGLLAAAILALVYAIVERVEWYYAAAIATVLVILVFLLILRFARSSIPHQVETPRTAETQPAVSEQPQRGSTGSVVPSEAPEAKSDDEKVLKKAIKAEQKRRKKESKAKEKDD